MKKSLTVTINKTRLSVKEYQGQRVVTMKEIDAVHQRPEGTARKRFNDNKEHFIEGVDYFVRNTDEAMTEFGITAPNGLTLITESGYLMLVKSFTDDLAWAVQRQLVNIYFRATPEQRRKSTLKSPQELAAADKRAAAMLLNAKTRAASNLQRLYDRAGVKPEYQALAISDLYAADGVKLPRIALQGTKVTYDKGSIAEKVGIYSKASGGKKPHAQAVGAIINALDIEADEVEAVPYCHNGHDGTDYQYTESVVGKIRAWVEVHEWPTSLTAGGKKYEVIYKEGR